MFSSNSLLGLIEKLLLKPTDPVPALMRLPIIKHTLDFIKDNDVDYIEECIAVLEYITESSNINDEEIGVIGELLSNLYGAIEVNQAIINGSNQKDALNQFMERVIGSIN